MATVQPTYVLRGGAQVRAQPYDCLNTQMFIFLLHADPQALTRLCGSCFNTPSGGTLRYHPLLPAVMLVAAEIERVNVGLTDGRLCYTPETDVAFWVPLVAVERELGFDVARRIVWHLPYLFVDSTWAVASGREIYGFPKEVSTFEQELDDTAAGRNLKRLDIKTWVVEHYGENAPIVNRSIVTVERQGAGGAAEAAWGSVREGVHEMVAALAGGGTKRLTLPGLGLLAELGDLLLHERYPMLFLQQFPSVSDGLLASSQAIIEAPVSISNFHLGGPMPGTYQVNIGQFESHPIIADLGLAGPQITAAASWHMRFDFRMENGQVLWSAP